jgi:hypothetical protein
MKRMLLVVTLMACCVVQVFAQYPNVTIRQIGEVPMDSLLLADNLQNTQPLRWTLQKSPLMSWASPFKGDTVTVTALCVVPAKILTFTQAGYTMLLADTGESHPWGGLLVRANDTVKAITDGFMNVAAGDIITMTGVVSEFPTFSMNSVTQFAPIPNIPINIIGSAPIPPPIRKSIGDFYLGIDPAGLVRYSTGEPYESMYVEFTNMVVDAIVNPGRGTVSMVDADGNQMSMYDASKYYTFGQSFPGNVTGPPDTTWQRIFPPVGTQVDTIRGFMTTVSGQENPRGYRICPVYRDDLVLGIPLPSVTTHRRNPVVVPPDSSPRITVQALKQTGGEGIASVKIWMSDDWGPFSSGEMTYQSVDTTYFYQIPQKPAGTFVRYFIEATDSVANKVVLASSAFGGTALDTSKGFFFYEVLDRPMTIRDVQYTPFLNGRSPYIGAEVTVSGVVTADTAHISLAASVAAATSAWYMQSGNEKYSGIWLTTTDTTVQHQMETLVNGDSISVTGTVQENFEVTRLGDISAVTKLASGVPEPAPVDLQTGDFGPIVGNGFFSAEPYEGMLVRFTNVAVADTNPVYSDPREYAVDDGSGPVIVRQDGRNDYANNAADASIGKTILYLGDQISSLTGVIHFSFRRYKIVPRTNADFGTITTSVERLSDAALPHETTLDQNYPNPFNPTTLIQYQLPQAARVSLKIYNLLGQEVRTLVDEVQQPGTYRARFDGTSVASGLYFYRLRAGDFTQVKKMLLVK